MTDYKKASIDTAPHYTWGQQCDGWRLVDTPQLTIIQERMPPHTAEQLHSHEQVQQYFHVLSGQAAFDIDSTCVMVEMGEGVHIPPGHRHRILNETDQELLFIVTSQPSTAGDREEFTDF